MRTGATSVGSTILAVVYLQCHQGRDCQDGRLWFPGMLWCYTRRNILECVSVTHKRVVLGSNHDILVHPPGLLGRSQVILHSLQFACLGTRMAGSGSGAQSRCNCTSDRLWPGNGKHRTRGSKQLQKKISRFWISDLGIFWGGGK